MLNLFKKQILRSLNDVFDMYVCSYYVIVATESSEYFGLHKSCPFCFRYIGKTEKYSKCKENYTIMKEEICSILQYAKF